jgi:formate hydrogenlyase subunit 3/multisubunit Na+/H+ antiporter MnhD subunit
MITLFIFYIHTVAAVTFFTRRWQEANWKEGLLAVGFLLLIFSVGWTMSTFLVGLCIGERGFGVLLDRDTLSLVLLTVMESVFYYSQLKRRRGDDADPAVYSP